MQILTKEKYQHIKARRAETHKIKIIISITRLRYRLGKESQIRHKEEIGLSNVKVT